MSNANNERIELWKTRIEDCKSSGLNIRSWCKDNKVSASQYHYWINKLYKEESSDNVKWAKVTLEPENEKTINESPIILHFHGVKMEIPKALKKDAIAEVLAAIASVC